MEHKKEPLIKGTLVLDLSMHMTWEINEVALTHIVVSSALLVDTVVEDSAKRALGYRDIGGAYSYAARVGRDTEGTGNYCCEVPMGCRTLAKTILEELLE